MGANLSVAVAVGIPLSVSFGIGFSIQRELKTQGWYDGLKKPSWTPPKWAFGPAWTVLYIMMGVASWQVWKAGGGWVPLSLYGLQLVLNWAWTPLFFGKKDLGLALADITALVGVLSATIVEFNKVDPSAAKLLMPYLGWTLFASALNYNIWANNTTKEDGTVKTDGTVKQAPPTVTTEVPRDIIKEAQALSKE